MRRRARGIALAAGVLLAAFGVLLAVQHRTEAAVPRLVQRGAEVPGFELTTLEGDAIGAEQLRGSTYVVNFFNSWCIPCLREAPALDAFYARHRGEPGFAMLGIVRDDTDAAIRGYVRDRGISWPVALDPRGRAALGFGTTGQPETYVIAADGTAVCGRLGESTLDELEQFLAIARAGERCR